MFRCGNLFQDKIENSGFFIQELKIESSLPQYLSRVVIHERAVTCAKSNLSFCELVCFVKFFRSKGVVDEKAKV